MEKKNEKSFLRQDILMRRRQMTPEEWRGKSSTIVEKILQIKRILEFETYHVYFPINNEVDIRTLIEILWKQKKRVVMPRTLFEEKALAHYQVKSFEDLEPTFFHMQEPRTDLSLYEGPVDLIIVPGVAYDKRGNRMGYGGGFYDRFLSQKKALTLAPAFDYQMTESLPVEKHDTPVKSIITETAAYGLFS